ncbi:MAG: recombinase family protein [Oscillospiraceae bacterium]|nr:recombinase family protein [Oscillospiraceae bacterium]
MHTELINSAKISNPMDYNTAFYIRLSKEDDSEKESESVTNQRRLLQEFAQKHRLSVAGEYIDDGYSGTSFDRPDFKRMIADIEAGKINMVLTKDMSRLGRDYIQTGHYLERFFPANGVRYISLLDGVDTGVDSTANDITPFRAIMNDMYAKDISKKIASVKRDKQRRGEFIGWKPPYGYRQSPHSKNVIVPDDEAASVVRRMFELALTGVSCRQIAAHLNEAGVPTPAVYAKLTPARMGPYSGQWAAERVNATLKNEVYIGNMVQGRQRKINYKIKECRKMPPEEWVIVEGTHEGLVSRDVFDRVQRLIESRQRTRSRTYDYLLKGIIHCHECGYPLGVINRKSGGRELLYFVCRTYQRFTKESACTCHCVRVEIITAAVLEQINALCREYLDRDRCAQVVAKQQTQNNAAELREKELVQLQTQLTAKLDSVYNDKLAGVLDDADFQRIYGSIKEQRQRLQVKIKQLQRNVPPPAPPEQQAQELVERFLASTDTNRELLVSLIERIELTEQKELHIHWRFPQMNQR